MQSDSLLLTDGDSVGGVSPEGVVEEGAFQRWGGEECGLLCVVGGSGLWHMMGSDGSSPQGDEELLAEDGSLGWDDVPCGPGGAG